MNLEESEAFSKRVSKYLQVRGGEERNDAPKQRCIMLFFTKS